MEIKRTLRSHNTNQVQPLRKFSSKVKPEINSGQVQPGRKLSGKIKINKTEPKHETEIVCIDNVCKEVPKPAPLNESDLKGMEYVPLLDLFQHQARYNGVHIPNPFKDMVKNFDGYLKGKYSEERIDQMGDLSNLRLITGQLKRFMKD